MPFYDYLCQRCGPFTEVRPMAESADPQACPECGKSAPRAFLTAPYCSAISAELKVAHATNERSASAPKSLSGLRQSHGSGCGCCSGRSLSSKARKNAGDGAAAKSYPGRRPWMLSH